MNRSEVNQTLEKYGRINSVGFVDRIENLKALKIYTERLGPDYENYRMAILSSALQLDADVIYYSKKAIDESIKNKNVYLISEVNIFLGIHYRMNNQYEASFKHYISAVKAMPTARAYNNLADLYLLIGAHEEAKEFLSKAIKLLDKQEIMTDYDQSVLNTLYTNQTEADMMAGYYEEAIVSATALVESSKDINDIMGEGYGLILLGTAYIELESYDLALDYLQKAEYIFLSGGSASRNQVKGYLEQVLYLEAKCYNHQGDYLASINKLNLIEVQRNRNFELKISNYEALGERDTAYETYESFMSFLKDQESSRQLRQKDNFKTTVAIYETEKKATEYELLYDHTKSISEIGRQIIAAEKLDDVLQAIYSHVDKIMDFDAVAIGKVDDKYIHYNWVIDNNERLEPYQVEIENRNSFSAWVVRNKKNIRINDALTLEEVKKYKETAEINWYGSEMDSMLIVPIMFKTKVMGVISVQCSDKFKYNEYDLEVIIMLSSFIGLAMKNWQDTNSLRLANEKLEELSKTDALTGVSNRHILSEIVEDLFKFDPKKVHDISVVMIDIDHFKEYNDTYGHIEGDRCIIEIVNEMRNKLDVDDNRMFRYGGDEFVAIVPYLKYEEINTLLEDVRQSIEGLKIPNKKSKVSDYVTCSFGFTTVKKGESDYQKAFYMADEALYLAKAKGKNCIGYVKNEKDNNN